MDSTQCSTQSDLLDLTILNFSGFSAEGCHNFQNLKIQMTVSLFL